MTLQERETKLDAFLFSSGAFDLKKRPLQVGEKQGLCLYLGEYTDTAALQKIFIALQSISPDKIPGGLEELWKRYLPFPSAEIILSPQKAAQEVLKGSTLFFFEGWDGFCLVEAKEFALRDTQEPENDRTLRGPHIGLTESLGGNLVQIRRFLRTGELVTEKFTLGTKIQNDVAVLFLAGKADERLLDQIRKKLTKANIPALSMTQETLANLLFPPKGLQLLNPFPKVRYTERPDVVAATLMEGKIAIICDNSPSVMLLPECLFDFFEEADDYYFPPLTATYLRLVRGSVFFASIFLIPIWLLVVKYANFVPDSFSFILTEEGYAVPLFLQFLIIEFAMDGLKMASLNTPNTLSNSFSVIGGLLLGEFAVKSGWFVPQTILYSAFTGIANYVPTNYELGYSFKFMRMSLILLVEFLGLWGFLGGIFVWLLILISTRSVAGKGYLYPFFPFDADGISRLLFRHRKGREQKV